MSLRARFLAALACTLALSLALGVALVGWHAARSVRTELTTALEIGGQAVRAGLDELPGSADPGRELWRLVGAFDGDRHVRASLLDARGAVLAQSRLLAPALVAPRWFRVAIAPKLAPSDVAVVGTGDLGGAVVQLQADPANEIGEVWGELRDAALVLAVLCILTLLAVLWTLGRALRPVTGLLAGLARVGAGDYGARIAEAGPPELAALAGGFNRMAARLAEVQTQNARLQEQLLTLQEEERADLSRDLHDEIGPSLFAAGVTAATIQHLAEAGRGAEIPEQARAIQDAVAHVQRHVRDLLRRLRPVRAVEFGLGPAIGDLVAFWRGRHPGIAFSAEISADEAGMGEALKEVAYRIVQESLSNAVRHGTPSRVEVVVADVLGDTLVRVADDGMVAGAGSAEAARPGFGLTGMRERVAALGGTLAVGPAERGLGWTVMARLPPAPAMAPRASTAVIAPA